jgi:ferredoxin-NADP reductase
LALHSFSTLRHAFYETFLHLHIAFVLLAFVGLWLHLKGREQQNVMLVVLLAWALEVSSFLGPSDIQHVLTRLKRFMRLAIVFSRNLLGSGKTTALVEALPGDAMRITLKVARPWEFKPGQHMYLYIPSVGFWTSHPFSVAWSQEEEMITDEKGLVMSQQDVLALRKNTVSLLVRRRTGFTNKLYERTLRSSSGQISLPAFVEGPYGGIHSVDSYGTVLLFAGGVGITHQVPFVRHLVAGYAEGTVAVRRVTLVWIIQSPEHLEWIRPWMTTILGMERRREVLRIMLFITRPRNTKEIKSPSTTVQMFPGRPNTDTLIDMEIEHQIGAMGVMFCGTGSLGDDVRRACRRRQAISNIDFIEESFTW